MLHSPIYVGVQVMSDKYLLIQNDMNNLIYIYTIVLSYSIVTHSLHGKPV